MDFDESLASGPHARLAAMVGDWEGSASLWFEPGDPTTVEEIALRAELVAGGRSLRMTYESSMNGTPTTGELLLGYHLDGEAWQAAWSDSSHTGTLIMWFDGPGAPGDVPLLRGSYAAGEAVWGWHITFSLEDDELLVSHSNVIPDVGPLPGLEWRMRRAAG